MPPQERSIRVEGVVLRHSDFSEADRLLTIFTREFGKLSAIAKGVRKARSRKAGHVEPFTRVSLQLARGRDLFILTQAEALNVFANLREDLLLLGTASYVIELIDRSTTEEEENRSLYNLLARTLNRLDRGDDPNLVTRYFEMRLLDYVGFRPQLQVCTQCEAKIQAEDQYFSAMRGGVICPKCGYRDPGVRTISMQALKYLRHFQRSSYRDAARAAIPTAIYNEMETLMQYYLTYNLERGLNSPSFLRRIRRENRNENKV
jgi:DNA repair protein RecO (recombination protein O)